MQYKEVDITILEPLGHGMANVLKRYKEIVKITEVYQGLNLTKYIPDKTKDDVSEG